MYDSDDFDAEMDIDREGLNEYLGFNPESQDDYDPCDGCLGEDCICCEVYLERRQYELRNLQICPRCKDVLGLRGLGTEQGGRYPL